MEDEKQIRKEWAEATTRLIIKLSLDVEALKAIVIALSQKVERAENKMAESEASRN